MSEVPIERVTPKGLRTAAREFEFDILVYATGFDAFTGAYDRVDIRGPGDVALRDKWADGPLTYLGIFIPGIPNFVMLGGPQIAAANFPRGSEVAVDWITPLLEHMREREATRFDATEAAQNRWMDEVKTGYEALLIRKAKSWITGYNSNLEGHEYGHTRYNLFPLGGVEYAKRLEQEREGGYPSLQFSS